MAFTAKLKSKLEDDLENIKNGLGVKTKIGTLRFLIDTYKSKSELHKKNRGSGKTV